MPSSKLFFAIVALTSALAFSAVVRAAEAPKEEEPPSLSDAVSTELQKVNTAIQTESWDAALLGVQNALKVAKPNSYDWAYCQLHLAQIYLSRNKRDLGDYKNAIPALQAVISSGFWPKDKMLDWKYILAQLCAQEDRIVEAEKYVREWLAETPEPTADAYVLAVTFMVQRAQANADNPDKKLIEEALGEIRKGLRLGSKPNETLYYLQAACYQNLERWPETAEVMELLLGKNPRNKTHWAQLLSAYINAGDDLRAALTIERAQRYETLNTPRENIALAQLYHNMKQFDRSIEILERGLNDGSIEPSKTNWEMLGHAYQEMRQEFKAINTFVRADKHVQNGYFLALAGNAYYALGNNAEALKYLELAAKKKVDNMAQITLFGAYLAFELKEYERASALLKLAQDNLTTDRERNDYRGLREVVDQALTPPAPPKPAN